MVKISVVIPSGRDSKEVSLDLWHKFNDNENKDSEFKALLDKCLQTQTQYHLEPILNSLALQTIPQSDFEVIIVDRYRDDHHKYLDNLQYNYKIKHVKDKHSIWHDIFRDDLMYGDNKKKYTFPCPSNARNTGIIYADGEIIFFMDDTVFLPPDALRVTWTLWQENNHGSFFTVDRYHWDHIRKKFVLYQDRDWRKLMTHTLATTAVSIPLEWLLKANGFNEDFDGCMGSEDSELGLRLSYLYGHHGIVGHSQAYAWELGCENLHYGRVPIRHNEILLALTQNRLTKAKNTELPLVTRANETRPTQDDIEFYKREHQKMLDKGMITDLIREDIAFKFTEVPTFDLRKLREKIRTKFELKKVILDDKETWKLKCPSCGILGILDDDQFHGRVSTLCDCGFHKTVDYSKFVGEN